MKHDFKKFIITWLVMFIAIELAMNMFGFGKKSLEEQDKAESTIVLESMKSSYSEGREILYSVTNNTDKPLTLNQCKKDESKDSKKCVLHPPVQVSYYENGTWQSLELTKDVVGKDYQSIELQPGKSKTLSLLPFMGDSLKNLGKYKLELKVDEVVYSSPEFEVTEQGYFKKSWDFLIHKPIYNTLIFFIDISPSHSLGLGIILLTLLVRLILLHPSQKALRSQKRMQEVQPKLKAIQEKYKGNQERIAMETMMLWKSEKVSPFGSCLPLLLQFPVLIGLYYAVREVVMGGNVYNLYSFQRSFDFDSVQTVFLGMLNLAEKNMFVLPIIVALLQFVQMRMSFAKVQAKSNTSGGEQIDMQQVNKIMQYTLPVMIGFFTASLPAGVGLYWGTSTLFGIIQTFYVNRESKKSDEIKNSEGVKVEVLESKNDLLDKYLPHNNKK